MGDGGGPGNHSIFCYRNTGWCPAAAVALVYMTIVI